MTMFLDIIFGIKRGFEPAWCRNENQKLESIFIEEA